MSKMRASCITCRKAPRLTSKWLLWVTPSMVSVSCSDTELYMTYCVRSWKQACTRSPSLPRPRSSGSKVTPYSIHHLAVVVLDYDRPNSPTCRGGTELWRTQFATLLWWRWIMTDPIRHPAGMVLTIRIRCTKLRTVIVVNFGELCYTFVAEQFQNNWLLFWSILYVCSCVVFVVWSRFFLPGRFQDRLFMSLPVVFSGKVEL